MEQIVVYLVIVAGLVGFLLGLYSLGAPVLLRRGIRVPLIVDRDRIVADDDLDIDDSADDVHRFAAMSFQPGETTLLAPRQQVLPAEGGLDGEPETELTDVLQTVEQEVAAPLDTVDDEEATTEEEQTTFADVAASASEDGAPGALDGPLEGLDADGPESDEDVNGPLEEADDLRVEADGIGEAAADSGSDQGDEYEKAAAPPEMQVVARSGNDDMMALFEETAAESKSTQAWREDLPETSISDLLSDAREISQTIKARSSSKKDA